MLFHDAYLQDIQADRNSPSSLADHLKPADHISFQYIYQNTDAIIIRLDAWF